MIVKLLEYKKRKNKQINTPNKNEPNTDNEISKHGSSFTNPEYRDALKELREEAKKLDW
ncbi:hypothetical protein [Zooshikella harenae]|uniref:Uncharacterized protein n=1 Tax=Zooshikella harenae TaxID=2827238 RepID=A0ABS5ZIM8_9GAMM|nr:hypothetical protein [Zooshikella harenae]MBU2713929.1 hypothetical protein [Zooshikella harenae]